MPKWFLLGFIIRIDYFKEKEFVWVKTQNWKVWKYPHTPKKKKKIRKKEKKKKNRHTLVQRNKKEEGKYKEKKEDFEACDIEVNHR